MCPQCCIDGASIVPGYKTGLQLSRPVPKLRQHQRRTTCQMVLEFSLHKQVIVETAKCRCQPTKGPDQGELCRDAIDREAESNLFRKLETMFSFTLHFRERVSRREKVRVEVLAAERGKRQIADGVGDI